MGSQITEGFLLVPYWKTLSKTEFYDYYLNFGPPIGKFYTVLTFIAIVIPVSISIYCFLQKHTALKYSLISSFFAFLIIALFYLYFKNTNQQFYEAAFNTNQLKSVLRTWECLHWVRVVLEIISLAFLVIALNSLNKSKLTISA